MTYSEARKIAHAAGLSMYPCKPGREHDPISKGEEEFWMAKKSKLQKPATQVVSRLKATPVAKDIYDAAPPDARYILDNHVGVSVERIYYVDLHKLPTARRKEPSGKSTSSQAVSSNGYVPSDHQRDY